MDCEMFRKVRAAIQKDDTNTIRKIFKMNSEWLNQPHSINFLLSQVIESKMEEEMVEILVNHGKIQNFSELLGYAVYRGKLELAESLLKKGAKVNDVLDSEHKCSLHRVFCNSDTRKEMLQLLLRYGLDLLNTRNKSGDNILNQFIHHFVKKTDSDAVEIAEILADSGVPLDELDSDGLTPLHLSVLVGHASLVSFLIERGANVNEKIGRLCESEMFPLFLAVRQCEKTIADLLLSNGAEVNARNQYGWTALHVACMQQHKEIISLLVHKGANIGAIDESGKTPFGLL